MRLGRAQSAAQVGSQASRPPEARALQLAQTGHRWVRTWRSRRGHVPRVGV